MNKRHAIIVGGGVSGLVAAVELCRISICTKIPFKVTLLESQDRFGGVIQTHHQPSFTVEAAADAFYGGGEKGREAEKFCESLGLSDRLIEANNSFRHFFIYKNQKMISVPNIFTSFDLAALWRSPLLNFSAKARLLLEPWVVRNKESGDESFGQFVRRRLGTAFYKSMVRPIIRGVYLNDPETLSLEAAFPRLRNWEKTCGSLGKALWAEQHAKRKPQGERFLNFKQGLETWIQAMVRELSFCELRTCSTVRRWRRDKTGMVLVLENGETLRADAVCLAMNSSGASPLLQEADPELSRRLREIRHDALMTASWVFKASNFSVKIKNGGFLVPAADEEGYPFSSVKWFDAAPGGEYRCLRVFLSEAMSPEIFLENDEKVQEKILGSLREIFGIQGIPDFAHLQRYPAALPRYEVGHAQKIGKIEASLLKHPGLFLTGNSFSGFGISDCIHAARETAQKILAYCQT